MSTKKTASYELNQWVLSDKPIMDEFNEDNRKIDESLSKKVDKNIDVYDLPLGEKWSKETICNIWKDDMGVVHLSINALKNEGITTSDFFFTLPEGYRPSAEYRMSISVAGWPVTDQVETARVNIRANGEAYIFHRNSLPNPRFVFGSNQFIAKSI